MIICSLWQALFGCWTTSGILGNVLGSLLVVQSTLTGKLRIVRVNNLVVVGLTATALDTTGAWVLAVMLPIMTKLAARHALARVAETGVHIGRSCTSDSVLCRNALSASVTIRVWLESPVMAVSHCTLRGGRRGLDVRACLLVWWGRASWKLLGVELWYGIVADYSWH